MENTNDLIFILNQNFEIEYINENVFKRLLGYLKADLIGKRPLELIHWKDQKTANNIFNGNLQENNNIVKLRIKDQNNNYFRYEFKRKIFIDQNGDLKILIISRYIDKLEERLNEQRLKGSEEKFRTITEQWLMGICIIQDNCVKYLNQQLADLLGYTPEEILGWQPGEFFKTIHPDDRPMVLEQAQMRNDELDTGIRNYIARGVHKSGRIIWVEVWFKNIKYENKNAFLNTFIDISDKKNVEEKLRESEEKFRTITEQSVVGIGIVQDNLAKFVNQKFADIFGYSIEETLNWKPGEFIKTVHPGDRDFVMRQSKKKQHGSSDYLKNYQFRGLKKNGEVIWIDNFTKTISYEGRPAALSTFVDITDKIIVEQKLIESEKKYHHLYDNSPYFIGLVDMNGNLIDCNMAINEFMSLHNKENVVGKSFREILSLNEKNKYLIPIFAKFFIKAIKGDNVEPYEFELFRSKDDSLWLRIEGSLMELNDKKMIQFIIQDITERKQAEIALQQAVHHWATTFNAMSDSVILLDQDNRIVQCNKATLEILGKSNYHEIIGRPCWEVVHGVSEPVDWCPVVVMKITGHTESSIAQIGDKWVQISADPILDNKSHIIGAVHVISDITERKIAEEKLEQSEERYRLITENANDMISITNNESILEYVNESVHKKYLGYSKDELIGKNRVDNIHPDDAQKIIDFAEELREKGESMTEVRFRRKDRKYVWLQMKGKNFIDIDGKKKTLSVSRDITARKKIEQKLKESEKKYRLITDNSKEAVFVMDMNLKQTFASPASYDMLGYTPEELMGISIQKTNTPESLKVILEIIKEELEIEKQDDKDLNRFRRVEIQQIHKNGKIIDVEMSATFLRDDDNNAIGIIGLSRNISARKKAERKLKESEKKYRKAYKRANYYKDLFAHDINNILQTINSSAELIKYHLSDSEKNKDVIAISRIINKQVMRGAKLVSNVHTLSNLEEGDIPIESIEINNPLRNSIEFVKNVYTDKNIDVHIDSFNEAITVKANFLVQEAFDNLLNNAIKYNSNENVEISIRISKILMEEINYIKMEFIDNGIGVTDERKNLIFKRYEREHKGGKGMGVGLSLIKKIIKKYQGKIWVEDKVVGDYSKGSNFIILIPEANEAD